MVDGLIQILVPAQLYLICAPTNNTGFFKYEKWHKVWMDPNTPSSGKYIPEKWMCKIFFSSSCGNEAQSEANQTRQWSGPPPSFI